MSFKIKDPDRHLATENPVFMTRTERLWLFAEQHRSAVITGLILLCLMAVILGTLIWLQHDQEQQALALEHQAAQFYLDRSFDDPEEAEKNLEQAITLYKQILDDFPRSSSAELAWYFIGNALVEQQDYDGAIEAYQNYITQSGNNPTMLGLVYQRLGSTYLRKGNREKALQAYTQVLHTPGALNKDQVIFELAKLEETQEHTQQALTYYKQLVDQHPTSPFTSEATLRMKILEEPEELETAESDNEEAENVNSLEGKE